MGIDFSIIHLRAAPPFGVSSDQLPEFSPYKVSCDRSYAEQLDGDSIS
jgi:hypothetical protein